MVARYIGDAQWTALDADSKPTNAAVADTLTTLDTRRIFIHQGSAVWIEIGTGTGGGGGGGGGGFAAGGTIAKSGDGTTVVISIAHGLSPTPDLFYALPLNAAARGIISYSIDGTNINMTYPIAPAAGSSNLSYVWGAGYVNSASGGLTPTSTTTLTGKSISGTTNTFSNIPATAMQYAAGGRTKVFKIGSTYYAEKHDGTLISASGTFETVLQAALNQQGLVTIDQPGNFDFNTAGVSLPLSTELRMGRNTTLRPPTASAGFVCITIQPPDTSTNNTNSAVIGGRMERVSSQRDWTGILMQSLVGPSGLEWVTIEDIFIQAPYQAIFFKTAGTGFLTNLYLSKVVAYSPDIGYDWDIGGTGSGMNRCVFEDVSVQAHVGVSPTWSSTRIGFRDVGKKDLTFRDCKVWDMNIGNNPAHRTMRIHGDGNNIRIKGGIIARPLYFENNSSFKNSIYIESDEWNTPSYGNESLTQTSFVQLGRRKGGWTPAGGWGITSGVWTTNGLGTTSGPNVVFADATMSQTFTAADAVATSGFGIRFNKFITCRGWNPIYKAKVRINTTGGRRAMFGLVGSTSLDISGDDSLNALYGMAFGTRAADANWRIFSNNGAGGSGIADTGIAVNVGAITTLEIQAQDFATNKFRYSIDNSPWTEFVSVEIPTQSATLTPYAAMANGTSTQKNFDLFEVYVETQ